MFAYVDTYNLLRATPRKRHRMFTVAATKIDYELVFRVFPNALAKQRFDFANAFVCAAVAITRLAVGANPTEQAVTHCSTNNPHDR
jgi:hypothetical protein